MGMLKFSPYFSLTNIFEFLEECDPLPVPNTKIMLPEEGRLKNLSDFSELSEALEDNTEDLNSQELEDESSFTPLNTFLPNFCMKLDAIPRIRIILGVLLFFGLTRELIMTKKSRTLQITVECFSSTLCFDRKSFWTQLLFIKCG